MIGVGILRCFFLASIMVWYSASVWQTVDKYFRDQFRVYLEKEYENNAEIKKDVMMEAERIAAKKAMIERIAKLQFSKSLDEYEKMSGLADEASQGGEKVAEGMEKVEEGSSEVSEVGKSVEDRGETDGTESTEGGGGTEGSGGTRVFLEEKGELRDKEDQETDEDETLSNEDAEQSCEFSEEKDECRPSEYEENDEDEGGCRKWRGSFADDEEVCHFEDLGKKYSCSQPDAMDNEGIGNE